MAAPAFSSATAQGSATATTTATVTLPTTAANDILILSAVNAGATAAPTLTTGTFTLDTSWTLIDSGTWTTGYGACWWVRCSGNHSGQTQIVSGTTDSVSCQVIRITGAITTGSPIDTASVTGATLGAVAGGALTGVSTTALETLVCYLGAVDDDQTATSPTKNAVAMSNLSTSTSTGGADSRVWYANSSQAVAGTTGNFAITNAAGTAQGKRVSSFAVLSVRQVVLQSASCISSATLSLKAPTYIKGSTYKALVQSYTPTVYWPLDGTDGATDQSGNGWNGTGYGGISIGAFSGSPINGETTSTDFAGDGDDQVYTFSYIVPNAQAVTYTGWAYIDTYKNINILAKANASPPGFVAVDLAGNVLFTANNAEFDYITTWPGAGQWVHWALVFDEPNDTVNVYINGVAGTPQTHTAAFTASAYLSFSEVGSSDFDGKMAHVAVFERALTAAEIGVLAHTLPPLLSSGQSSATLSLTTPAIIASGYRLGVKALGPGLEWPLDAGYGATDQSGNGRDGTAAGGPTITLGGFSGSPITGETTATEFVPASDHHITSTYNPFVASTIRTFTGWAYRDNTSADHGFFHGDTGTRQAFWIASGGSDVKFTAQNGAGDTTWTAAWPGTSQWVHWALVFNDSADTAELYINGASQGSQAHTRVYQAGNVLWLGRYGSGFAQFDGKMAHVAVFEKALTASEISTLYTLKNYPPLTASGQSSATLSVSIPMGPIPLAPASCQSSATLKLAAVFVLTSSGVSSATLTLKAPTRVVLATASCVSSATLALTAKPTIVFAPAACVSSATLNLAQYVPLGSAVCVSSATLNLTAVARLSLTVSGQLSATLALTAPTRLTLTASSVSSATLSLTALTRITLQASSGVSSATLALTALTRITLAPASCVSSASLNLAQYVPLGAASCVSSATLALTAPAKVILATAACQSSATLALYTPGGGLVPAGAATGVSSATLVLKAPTQVPLGAASGVSSASLALKAQARVLLASSDGTSAATLLLTALTQIPFAPVFALSDGSLVVTVPSVAVEIPLGSADGLSSATLVVTAPTVVPPEPEPEPTYEFTLRRILTTYPVGTEVGVYEGEPDVYDNYGMRRLPPVEPVQTLTVEADPFTISDLSEGNYFTIGTYQRAVRPRGDPDFETVLQTISFRVP